MRVVERNTIEVEIKELENVAAWKLQICAKWGSLVARWNVSC